MPWCPKCNMEYVKGITVCPDCGSPLAENRTAAADLTPVFAGAEDAAERIAQFLDYSGISSVTAGEPNEHGYPVLVSKKDYDESMKLVRVFLYKQAEQKEQAAAGNQPGQPEAAKKAPAPYVKKADKYEDMNSSAITLLAVGTAGMVFILLKLFGILPISFGSASWLFDIVMSAIFLFFLAAGFSSWKRAKKIKGEISEEVTATEKITEWFLEEYTGRSIDIIALEDSSDMPDELKYFKRTEFIKKELNTRLTELDEAYLEDLTESLYQKLYENA